MITKFTTVYAGHVDLPDRGQDATPANERRYSNEQLASVFDKTEAIAKKMDELGYDTLVARRASFPARGLRVHPQHPDAGGAPGAGDEAAEDRLRLQYRADVAPAAARRGFRDRRHPDRRAHDLRASAAAITRREVETFGAPMLDQNANRELFEEQVEIIFKAFNNESFSHKGKYYTLAAARCRIAATSSRN